jgi:hypothetical protein
MKTSKVAMLHQLLEILQHCQATDFANFLTWDESWLFLESPHCDMSATSRGKLTKTAMTEIDTEKCTISIIWFISGIHIPFALTEGMKYNSQSFWQHAFRISISRKISAHRAAENSEGYFWHLHNAPAHNPRLASEKIELETAKESCIHFLVQMMPSIKELLPLCLSQRKIPRDIVQYK